VSNVCIHAARDVASRPCSSRLQCASALQIFLRVCTCSSEFRNGGSCCSSSFLDLSALHSLHLYSCIMAPSSKVLGSFLRTVRLSGKSQPSPLVCLQRQSRSPVLNLARTYAQFARDKPHVNIGMQTSLESRGAWILILLSVTGTIGHVDHGKVVSQALALSDAADKHRI
jgi:hypothetical protein